MHWLCRKHYLSSCYKYSCWCRFFFYHLSGWSRQFMHGAESLSVLGVPWSYFSCCKRPHSRLWKCSYLRARWPSGFCAAFWCWRWYCGQVIWGLMLQLKAGMKRQTWIFPSVRSIPSVHVAGARLLCCSSECVSHLLSPSAKLVASNSTAWVVDPSWAAHAAQSCPSR